MGTKIWKNNVKNNFPLQLTSLSHHPLPLTLFTHYLHSLPYHYTVTLYHYHRLPYTHFTIINAHTKLLSAISSHTPLSLKNTNTNSHTHTHIHRMRLSHPVFLYVALNFSHMRAQKWFKVFISALKSLKCAQNGSTCYHALTCAQ